MRRPHRLLLVSSLCGLAAGLAFVLLAVSNAPDGGAVTSRRVDRALAAPAAASAPAAGPLAASGPVTGGAGATGVAAIATAAASAVVSTGAVAATGADTPAPAPATTAPAGSDPVAPPAPGAACQALGAPDDERTREPAALLRSRLPSTVWVELDVDQGRVVDARLPGNPSPDAAGTALLAWVRALHFPSGQSASGCRVAWHVDPE